jgi:uncharacterized membrane protein YccC
MSNGISRRVVTQRLLLASFAGSFLTYGQERRDARDLVDRVQEDLQRAADFTRNNAKERERYHNAQHHLSEFDRQMRSGHFDKGKLDDAIDDLKNLVQNNTLESRDRDALATDLADLRVMRDTR